MPRLQAHLARIPPIQLRDLRSGDAAALKPAPVPQRREEVGVGEARLDALDGWVGEVVIVVVGDDDGVNDGEVLELAGRRVVAFKAVDGDGRAAVLEDGVEEDAQAAGELDVVAGVAEPGGAQLGGLSGGEEGGGADGDGRGCGVRGVPVTGEFLPAR